MTTSHQSPALAVRDAAAICRVAQLPAFAHFDHMVGNHVRIESETPAAGHYLITPTTEDRFKVRWVPDEGPIVVFDLAATPAHAAGLILDHQNGLLP